LILRNEGSKIGLRLKDCIQIFLIESKAEGNMDSENQFF